VDAPEPDYDLFEAPLVGLHGWWCPFCDRIHFNCAYTVECDL
jgi:hypothetical protein